MLGNGFDRLLEKWNMISIINISYLTFNPSTNEKKQ